MIGNIICFVLGVMFGFGIFVASYEHRLQQLCKLADDAERVVDWATQKLAELEEARHEQDAEREG